jgi:hypothetical protein
MPTQEILLNLKVLCYFRNTFGTIFFLKYDVELHLTSDPFHVICRGYFIAIERSVHIDLTDLRKQY